MRGQGFSEPRQRGQFDEFILINGAVLYIADFLIKRLEQSLDRAICAAFGYIASKAIGEGLT
ncbi:hypothetical protein [Limibacillus halophilus]|uniref:Uncharacterized protein n=1 Tax=Limibacillus halophilus TaxID=1579333 RepID=A0A839SUC0_9PROT|nr:hypothetical protein [Limibacillus halophilus]MBB3065599.1 hypothetical protein [Limibacillus halophilus]